MPRTLDDPIFTEENAAREYLERVLWPDGPRCPRCGSFDRITKCEGETYRAGLHNCGSCRRQFSVTVGTVYERSHVPLHKWLLATRLLSSSKKGMSAHQLHRTLGVTYKTAWFMAHRIREGMVDKEPEGLGGQGKTVEADETYYGEKDDPTERRKQGSAVPPASVQSSAW
jgi:transposase-like protein